jgi:hypothetical protein
MFGMLDYRAHKLLWLLCLPFNLAAKICFFVVIAASVLIGQQVSHSVFVKILVAYLCFEGIALVVINIIFGGVFYFVRKFFSGSLT